MVSQQKKKGILPIMDKRFVVFAYNFPHKKTQDFLLRMSLYGLRPALVLTSPPKKLDLPKSFLRDKYKNIDLLYPEDMCRMMGVPCIEINHNDRSVPAILNQHEVEFGVIGGARILSPHILKSLPMGIINHHPGLIPENRGLNAVKWAVKLSLPQGMTVHLIDRKIDRGSIIKKYIVPVYGTDSLKDINMRIYESQIWSLIMSLRFFDGPYAVTKLDCNTGYHPPADEKIDNETLEKLSEYKAFWSIDKNGWRCRCHSKNLSIKGDDVLCLDCMAKYKIIENREVGEILEVCLR